MAREQEKGVLAPSSQLPSGRLSALLRELAVVPRAEGGSAWERALAPGVVIGRFELVREVGRGGFGVVYEARDKELGRTVAFKAVRVGGRFGVREERLLREAEAAARLSHPNIVTLYDVGRSEQGPYLILEFLRGQTLGRRLEQGPIALREALRIAMDVAKAIAHAHQNGVVHRDLTPGNVFLCEDGQVKVLDLGMAHAFGQQRLEGGTPGYMAPEQQRGAPEDERTDVFALGVILYRMLANELPFPATASRAAGPAATLEVPGAPALGPLIARMLQNDPVKRPREAGAIVADLAVFQRELERSPSQGEPAAARKRPRWPVRAVPLVTAAILIVAAALGASWMLTRRAPEGPFTAPSIAVLPFADMSPDQDQEYFSDGLADDILNALARLDGVRVPSRTSSFFFKGKNVRLADIGRELNVRTVLEGSVRKEGNRVRVNARIVNVADGYRLWAETYDRELTDIFAVQEDIARAVVSALGMKLIGGNEPSASSRSTRNPDVYALYLFGRQQYYQYTLESWRRGVEAYEKALALDPRYAPAWAGLAIPLHNLSDRAATPAAAAAERRRALEAAEKAVALAPDLPEALSARGTLRAAVNFDWTGAEEDLKRALAASPNDADSHRRYAILLEDLGRFDEAMAEARKAVELDPLGPSWTVVGALHQFAGELDQAEAAFRRHLQIWPNNAPSSLHLGRNRLLRSKPKEALALFERFPDEYHRLWGRAVAEHALGDRQASQAALDALVSRYSHTKALSIAEVYAWRGEKDRAFEWLDRAFAQHDGDMSGMFRIDPFLRGLRGDKRYAALLRKMNLPPE